MLGLSQEYSELTTTSSTFFVYLSGSSKILSDIRKSERLSGDLFRCPKIRSVVRRSFQISENPIGCPEISSDIRKSDRLSGDLFRYSKIRAVVRRSFQMFENPPSSSEIQKDRSIAVLLSLADGLLHRLRGSRIEFHDHPPRRRRDAPTRQIRDARRLLPKNAIVFTHVDPPGSIGISDK